MGEIIQGYDNCPSYAPVFGFMAASLCAILSNFGAAWGTWRAGSGVCKMGVDYPKGIIKNIIPIVMAGVLGIYGLIVSVIIAQSITSPRNDEGLTSYSLYSGYAHMAAGLCCGMSCLAAGGTIGLIGEIGVQCYGLKACNGKRAWLTGEGADPRSADTGAGNIRETLTVEAANKLYVGLLIMLIFSEAIALYGLIVALILSQHSYVCENN